MELNLNDKDLDEMLTKEINLKRELIEHYIKLLIPELNREYFSLLHYFNKLPSSRFGITKDKEENKIQLKLEEIKILNNILDFLIVITDEYL